MRRVLEKRTQDKAKNRRKDKHMAKGICIRFQGGGSHLSSLEKAIEAAHWTENVLIQHTKVKEENILCSLYTVPLHKKRAVLLCGFVRVSSLLFVSVSVRTATTSRTFLLI